MERKERPTDVYSARPWNNENPKDVLKRGRLNLMVEKADKIKTEEKPKEEGTVLYLELV